MTQSSHKHRDRTLLGISEDEADLEHHL